jgi:hypothetical protein
MSLERVRVELARSSTVCANKQKPCQTPMNKVGGEKCLGAEPTRHADPGTLTILSNSFGQRRTWAVEVCQLIVEKGAVHESLIVANAACSVSVASSKQPGIDHPPNLPSGLGISSRWT